MSNLHIQSGVGSTVGKCFESIKDAVIWSGRQISAGFFKLVELLKATWNKVQPILKDFAIKTGQFLRTTTGIGLLLGTISLGISFSANRMDNKKWCSTALQITSFVLAIASGALLGFSFAMPQSTRLF